jgi:predicted nucleic acid-binding protein
VCYDSSANLAILDRGDAHHDEAMAILREQRRGHVATVTTTTVIIETHALILSVGGRTFARRFLVDLESSDTRIGQVRARDEAAGRAILLQYTDRDWSFTDAISFAVMDRLRIRLAFTFDDDFTQYGFTRLTPALLYPR